MVIKKSVLLSIIALGLLMQAPVSAVKIPAKIYEAGDAAVGWFSEKADPEILFAFNSPAQIVQHAVICALVARVIQGKASAADYSKVAAYSFAGSMATSILHSGAGKGLKKLNGYKRTEIGLVILTLVAELAILSAGQNPDVVKSIVASFKAKTAGKDLTALILSLNKDVNRRQRLAALVRTFGPFFLELATLKFSDLTYAAYRHVKS